MQSESPRDAEGMVVDYNALALKQDRIITSLCAVLKNTSTDPRSPAQLDDLVDGLIIDPETYPDSVAVIIIKDDTIQEYLAKGGQLYLMVYAKAREEVVAVALGDSLEDINAREAIISLLTQARAKLPADRESFIAQFGNGITSL